MTHSRGFVASVHSLLVVSLCTIISLAASPNNYLAQAYQSLIDSIEPLASSSLASTPATLNNAVYIATILQTEAAQANSTDINQFFNAASNNIALLNTFNNQGNLPDITPAVNLFQTIATSAQSALDANTLNSDNFASVWNNTCVPLHSLINTLYSPSTYPTIASSMSSLNTFMSGKTTDYTPSGSDFTSLKTKATKLQRALNPFQIIALPNNTPALQLIPATVSSNPYVFALLPNNKIAKYGLNGSLISNKTIPSGNTIINSSQPDQSNNLWLGDNFFAFGPGINVIEQYNLNSETLVNGTTLPGTFINSQFKQCVSHTPFLVVENFSQKPTFDPVACILAFAYPSTSLLLNLKTNPSFFNFESGTLIGSNPTSFSSDNMTNQFFNSLSMLTLDGQYNVWAGSNNTANNGAYNGLVKYSIQYATQGSSIFMYRMQLPHTAIPLPEAAQGQLLSYLTKDKNGYPVIVTSQYTHNATHYPSMVYVLNYNGSVQQSYSLGNVSVSPQLAVDSSNNFWVFINGTTLMQVNTTTQATTSYPLTKQISTLQDQNTAAYLTTVTPTSLVVDANDNPWLTIQEAAYALCLTLN